MRWSPPEQKAQPPSLGDGPFPVSDGHETAVAEQAFEPIGCVRGGVWYEARTLPTFATVGKTWGPAADDSDW